MPEVFTVIGLIVVAVCLFWQGFTNYKAFHADDKVSELQEKLDKQQRRIDELARELEDLKRSR